MDGISYFPSQSRLSLAAWPLLIAMFFASSVADAQPPAAALEEPVRARHAMVVTIHHDATDAGVQILREGGNAVDAAVAVGFQVRVSAA